MITSNSYIHFFPGGKYTFQHAKVQKLLEKTALDFQNFPI